MNVLNIILVAVVLAMAMNEDVVDAGCERCRDAWNADLCENGYAGCLQWNECVSANEGSCCTAAWNGVTKCGKCSGNPPACRGPVLVGCTNCAAPAKAGKCDNNYDGGCLQFDQCKAGNVGKCCRGFFNGVEGCGKCASNPSGKIACGGPL